MTTTYITTTIPYVNARPHLGFALELVQADVLARYYRAVSGAVRLQAGTDDNSLKNVLAAQAAGIDVQEFVDANAAAFTGLKQPLNLTIDDLIRTSSDPRHRRGVERLWRACAASGDLYRRHYEGRTSKPGGPARPGASTSWAKECSGSTPSAGPRCCCPPARPYPPTSSSTVTSPRTAARSANRAAPPSTRMTSSPGTGRTRCAGGCCARCHGGGDADFTVDRLPGHRHAPASVPAGRRVQDYQPVHPERGRVPPGPLPAPGEAHQPVRRV
jgi:tRNA synthetases class I (M)